MSDAVSDVGTMANDGAVDNLLGAAIAALRDGALVGADDGEHTRRRVMSSMGERARGRKWRVGFAVLAFALSTATLSWAASTGRLDGVMEAVGIGASGQSQSQIQSPSQSPSLSPTPDPIRDADPDPQAQPQPQPQPHAQPQPQPQPSPVTRSLSPVTRSPSPVTRTPSPVTRSPSPVTRSPSPVTRSPSPSPSPSPSLSSLPSPAPTPSPRPTPAPAPSPADLDLLAYRHAHDLHFHANNTAAALAAWDAYLASHPHGRFATEARYNRGIALAKLGRRADARAALAPFARGEVDSGYRQREAAALVDALGAP